MYSNHVTYWYRNNRKFYKERKICFASLLYQSLKEVRFICEIDQSLTPEEVTYYLDFLKKILEPYKYRQFKKHIWFQLFKKDFKIDGIYSEYKFLLYLTLFRYPQEFPEIVKWLYQNRKPSIEEDFDEFQRLHCDFVIYSRKNPVKYNNLGGHGVLYNYGWTNRDIATISLSKFQTKLTTRLGGVQNYLRS